MLFFGFLIESGSALISAVLTTSGSLEDEFDGESSALSNIIIGSTYTGDSSLIGSETV